MWVLDMALNVFFWTELSLYTVMCCMCNIYSTCCLLNSSFRSLSTDNHTFSSNLWNSTHCPSALSTGVFQPAPSRGRLSRATGGRWSVCSVSRDTATRRACSEVWCPTAPAPCTCWTTTTWDRPGWACRTHHDMKLDIYFISSSYLHWHFVLLQHMLSKVSTWNFDIFLFDRLTNGKIINNYLTLQ